MSVLGLLFGMLLGAALTAAAGLSLHGSALRFCYRRMRAMHEEVALLEAALANRHRLIDHLQNHGRPGVGGVYR